MKKRCRFKRDEHLQCNIIETKAKIETKTKIITKGLFIWRLAASVRWAGSPS